MAFGTRLEPWDGRWTVAAFSVPEAQRALRHVLRTRLLWLGFAPPGGRPHHRLGPGAHRKLHQGFVEEYETLLERVLQGGVGASEALITRTALMDTWRNFPNLDPELPDQLLPPGWPRRQARDIFAEVYNGLGSLAEVRVKQVVSRYAPELTGFVRHHTTGG